MKRRLIIAALLLVGLLAGGWIFHTRVVPANADYSATFNGTHEVSVWFEHGTALDAAQKAAADYQQAGWDELPVSTATFKVFTKGSRSAALLAEDLPSGVRVTELKRK